MILITYNPTQRTRVTMAMFQKDVQGSLKPHVIVSPGFDEHPFPEMSPGRNITHLGPMIPDVSFIQLGCSSHYLRLNRSLSWTWLLLCQSHPKIIPMQKRCRILTMGLVPEKWLPGYPKRIDASAGHFALYWPGNQTLNMAMENPLQNQVLTGKSSICPLPRLIAGG